MERDSGRIPSTGTRPRKGSIDVMGADGGDDDDDSDHVEEEGEGAWAFPEIRWKLSKAFRSDEDMIRFAF